MKFLDGWARKVALVAILASALGWLIFIICFGGFNNADNFYNDIRKNKLLNSANPITLPVNMNGTRVFVNTTRVPVVLVLKEKDIEEDFPKDRADGDGLTHYFFAVVFPLSVVLIVAHLFLHAVPILGFILSLAAHLLLSVSLVCGAGAYWADGTRLFSSDNNLRNTFTPTIVPDDWLYEEYWGSWLLGEWVGLLLAGIFVILYFTVTPFFTNYPSSKTGLKDIEMEAKNPL